MCEAMIHERFRTLQVPSLGEGASFGHREAVVNAMVYVHTTLHTVNRRCARRGQRVMAITPRHFLDFIQVSWKMKRKTIHIYLEMHF